MPPYKSKLELYLQSVDVEDDLYKFTLAHFKTGNRKAVKYIPQKDRGFDKESGTRRSTHYAHPLHRLYMSLLIRRDKVQKRAENFHVKIESQRPQMATV